MNNTEDWWVCNKCDKPIISAVQDDPNVENDPKETLIAHRKICDPLASFSIKQVSQ